MSMQYIALLILVGFVSIQPLFLAMVRSKRLGIMAKHKAALIENKAIEDKLNDAKKLTEQQKIAIQELNLKSDRLSKTVAHMEETEQARKSKTTDAEKRLLNLLLLKGDIDPNRIATVIEGLQEQCLSKGLEIQKLKDQNRIDIKCLDDSRDTIKDQRVEINALNKILKEKDREIGELKSTNKSKDNLLRDCLLDKFPPSLAELILDYRHPVHLDDDLGDSGAFNGFDEGDDDGLSDLSKSVNNVPISGSPKADKTLKKMKNLEPSSRNIGSSFGISPPI